MNDTIPGLLWRLLRVLWNRVGPEPPLCPRCQEPLRLTTYPETKVKVWGCDECYKDKGADIL